MNRNQIIAVQKRIGTNPDGFWGPASIAACQKHLRALMPKVNPWPKSDSASLRAFYGQTGDESQLVGIDVRGYGVRYDGDITKTVRCHHKVANSLQRIIKEIHISPFAYVLSEYNGCFNFRKMRGGTSFSLHAYGAAIDFMASTNGLKTHWPMRSTMPIEVMEIFAREGWLSAGAYWGRDAMHFQATT